MVTARITQMAPRGIFLGLLFLIAAAGEMSASIGPTDPGARIGPIVLRSDDPIARELVQWSFGRYESAGLHIPPVEVYFHDEEDGCAGYVGTAVGGRIDLCIRLEMDSGPQRIVLHELAHVWVEVNVGDGLRQGFLDLRGLTGWAEATDPWKRRGTEQAADVIAWGLGDGSMLPLIDGDTEPKALTDAFTLLTQADPLQPAS